MRRPPWNHYGSLSQAFLVVVVVVVIIVVVVVGVLAAAAVRASSSSNRLPAPGAGEVPAPGRCPQRRAGAGCRRREWGGQGGPSAGVEPGGVVEKQS